MIGLRRLHALLARGNADGYAAAVAFLSVFALWLYTL